MATFFHSGRRLTTATSPQRLKARPKLPKQPLHNGQLIYNGNRTEWSPIRSVIIRVITKSDDRAAGARFVNHEYDYRLNWTTQCPVTNQS